MNETAHLYKIKFTNQDEVYEIYAGYISHDEVMGFLSVEELVFSNDASGVIVDPSLERLKSEFKEVQSTFIPLHNIIRIDVVKVADKAKITDLESEGNVTRFPSTLYQSRPK